MAEYGAIFGGAGVDLGLSAAVRYENCFTLARTGGMGVRCAQFLDQNGDSGYHLFLWSTDPVVHGRQ
jgi:hypothetical protein